MKNVTTKGPLRKSSANPPPPLIEEGKPRGKGMGSAAPTTPTSTAGRVLLSEGKPTGRDSSDSTFRAPRKEGGMSPAECGYTKPGK